MPPWIARQCHVWRAPHSIPGAWPISLGPSRFPRTLDTVRSYVQSAKQDENLKIRATNSAIIIPRSVTAQPDDLIAHIQPVEHARLTRDRFAVFLVTPAFASWLLDDQTFLRKALRRAYAHMLDHEGIPYARLHALCAVIDKLPVPRAIGDANTVQSEALDRIEQPPVLEDGFEGMAYTTLQFDDSIPASAPPTADTDATISFIKSDSANNMGEFRDALRLPLANTVFQTGRPSTMTYSSWIKNKGGSDLELQEKRDVLQHGIKLHRGGSSQQCISTLAVPLVPLTVPRRVDASMGNILRRVIGPDGRSVTASQELESIVPRYYNARGETSQATSVWALLIPKELIVRVLHKTNSLLGRPSRADPSASAGDRALWEALWKRDPSLWNDLIPSAVASNARLHRVLSGGGGWGKKAGLLSLDPIATTGDADWPDSQKSNDLSSALQEVVRDGDHIQFFISPSASSAGVGPEAQSEKLEEMAKVDTTWNWELGTIPSTMDSLPGGSWQHAAPASNNIFVFKHSFGALAEGGLTVERQFRLKSTDPFSIISGSKVDVPYSRFSAVNTGPNETELEEGSVRNSLEATRIPLNDALIRRLYRTDTPHFLGLERLETTFDRRRNTQNRVHVRKVKTAVIDIHKIKTRKLKAPTSKKPKATIRNYPSAGPSTEGRLLDKLKYYELKVVQACGAIQELTYEARVTMNTIQRLAKRPMDLSVYRRSLHDRHFLLRHVVTDRLPEQLLADVPARSTAVHRRRKGRALTPKKSHSQSDTKTAALKIRHIDRPAIRRYLSPTWRDKLEMMLKARYLQTEQKRKVIKELVTKVSEWLEMEDDNGSGVQVGEIERKFGEAAAGRDTRGLDKDGDGSGPDKSQK